MAGLYVHIPFCKSRCIYCDFYSTTREAEMDRYADALCQEIRSRSDEAAGTRVRTIYIGGGTPSLLSSSQLGRILQCIRSCYDLEAEVELTVEMNPEDVVVPPPHSSSVGGFKFSDLLADGSFSPLLGARGGLRISLGIQTFDDELLRLLQRRHAGQRALEAVGILQQAGISNISIDLIYGLPGQTMQQWEHDLDIAFALGIQHLSAYALSYEEGTRLWQMRLCGQVHEAGDELAVAMYQRLCQRAREAGFEHYEISNFAQPGFHSRHNSSYWTGVPYLGFGPGAHSFDGRRTRRSNRRNMDDYLRAWNCGAALRLADFEELTDDECYDEAVMCGLRTRRGIDLQGIGRRFGQQRLDYLLQMARPHLLGGRLRQSAGHLQPDEYAWMVSDDVMSDLMA